MTVREHNDALDIHAFWLAFVCAEIDTDTFYVLPEIEE